MCAVSPLVSALWDCDSLDWKGISAEEISPRVLKNVRPGSIVLFHNAAIHTPEALPGIDGYTIGPVSGLLPKDDTRVDNTGRLWAKSNQAQKAYGRVPVRSTVPLPRTL